MQLVAISNCLSVLNSHRPPPHTTFQSSNSSEDCKNAENKLVRGTNAFICTSMKRGLRGQDFLHKENNSAGTYLRSPRMDRETPPSQRPYPQSALRATHTSLTTNTNLQYTHLQALFVTSCALTFTPSRHLLLHLHLYVTLILLSFSKGFS